MDSPPPPSAPPKPQACFQILLQRISPLLTSHRAPLMRLPVLPCRHPNSDLNALYSRFGGQVSHSLSKVYPYAPETPNYLLGKVGG